ncbi:MAG: selenocysteine-specific translation elongation factor [Synergistaceae bacterium]|nr:selenocysteine-specific translation elongation factor [Synergistaceae bacterium]
MGEDQEISLVIGTAGHIDHGKTALVKTITGVDCDRLLEEKKRGITIELGFAPLRLEKSKQETPDGGALVVSVIDVPGHERFIRQMAAGAAGVDAVMLVIAADESVMPQTREHLAILELLGVKDGLVAVTKSDKVERDMLELVEEDVKDFVKGTFLEGKAVVPVSAVTGHNIDVLKKELAALVDRVRPRPRKGALFLPIDRAFPIAGFGTVVTGTAYRGTAKPGDEVEIFPSGREGRIRSLQVHGRPVSEAYAGQRVAVNLSGIAVDELARGDVVCRKGVYRATRCFDVMLKILPSVPVLKHWQRVRVYLGTSDVMARVSLLEGRRVLPGEEVPAQLIAEEDVVCTADERFVVRFYSPLATIGGGKVVFPYAHKPRGRAARLAASERIRALSVADAETRFSLLAEQAKVLDFDKAAAFLQETRDGMAALASGALKRGGVLELKGDKPVYVSRACFDELSSAVTGALGAYHASRASERGIPLDELSRMPALEKLGGKAARSLVSVLAEKNAVIVEDAWVRLPDFKIKDDDGLRRDIEALFAYCKERAFQPPTLGEARAELLKTNPKMDANAFSALIGSLKKSRRLALLPGEFLLTDEVENDMMNVLLKIEGNVTLASVRDATNSSRKFIMPILEYFDSKGYTRRVVDPKAGDVRVVKRAPKHLPFLP